MYHVIGQDGKQYGPVEEATLRDWIDKGLVGAASLSFKAGEAQWIPMRERAEFAEALAQKPPSAPPMPPAPRVPVAVTPDTPKDWLVTLLLSIFLGTFGVDRFYLGYTGLGIAKLVTFGGCGVWWLIDVILIAVGSVTDAQGRPLVKS